MKLHIGGCWSLIYRDTVRGRQRGKRSTVRHEKKTRRTVQPLFIILSYQQTLLFLPWPTALLVPQSAAAKSSEEIDRYEHLM
jgi:hypothetical protein